MQRIGLWIFSFCFFVAGFSQQMHVAVSIEPQRFLLERIAGKTAGVVVLVPAGKNPHNYEPTPQQMRELKRSSVWFQIGIEFEQALMPKVRSLYPTLRIVDTTVGIKRRLLKEEELAEHEEGDDHHDEDRAGAPDPHVWMSLRLMREQASQIYRTLAEVNPSQKALYQKNYEALVKDMEELDQELVKRLAPYKGRVFFVYHPVLGYFADDYGLKQVAIEIKGKEPSPSELSRVIRAARERKVKTIFVQEGFSKRSAEAVAKALGGRVVPINPLSADYLNMMRSIGDKLVEGWK
jgi:zinc transport system substrate-binding protein